MATRLKKRAVRKTKAASKIEKPTFHISPDEVVHLELQVALHKKAEATWLHMTSPPSGDEDRWSLVEDHLLSKPHESGHSLRRWKYFSK